jgi:Protein of unknown function (DUF3999)
MKTLLMVVLTLMAAVSVRGEDLDSADFFAGYYLETRGQGPFFRVELPAEVYLMVRRPDFSDIRIFNGAGEIVPHALRATAQLEEVAKTAVPFFPLYGENSTATPNLAVEVVRDSTGTIVTLKDDVQTAAGRPLRGYLFDLSGGKRGTGSLELYWQPATSSSIFTARLEHSDDLRVWKTLVVSAPLLDLQHHGERVEKREIALDTPPQRYLRLTWSESESLILMQASLAGKSSSSHRQYQWNNCGPGEVVSMPGRLDIDYRSDLRLPVTSARLGFNRPNSLAKIHLQSRASDKDQWRSRCRQTFYTLTYGTTQVHKDSCTFAPTVDALWRVTVEEDGAAIAASRLGPNLILGQETSELLFVARGGPPYLLAFGSERAVATTAGQGAGLVLEAIDASDASGRVFAAQLGRRIELGGEQVLQPLPPARPWKTWLLWAMLLLGVAMLALIARGLLREINENKEKETTKET